MKDTLLLHMISVSWRLHFFKDLVFFSLCFQVYVHDVDVVEHIMTYFLAMFQGLRVQMGVAFTEKVIHTFMNIFSGWVVNINQLLYLSHT